MKQTLGPENLLYPSLTVLAGAMVQGRPNFITIAHVGIMTLSHISLGMHKSHFTNQGIKEHGEFSVCIPSQDLVTQTDYCGIVSGKNTDKAAIFDVFYGGLKNAPLISQCPVCLECRLERVVDFPQHDAFVGEVVQAHADPEVLTSGKLDIAKLRPLLFDMPQKKYWALGPQLESCWSVGKNLKKELAK